ncbi:hypothetical protein CC80DRAFT_545873 [Byssothecium circinans]|uniref:Uncharacterized protein n=1 Tax=Byssothecium circinans TaxID=147558 RepID=A0A6A5U0U4_9PLEO|nr:hypothetical protein CC80DRAFT_545873 [Byssothecium circinans]
MAIHGNVSRICLSWIPTLPWLISIKISYIFAIGAESAWHGCMVKPSAPAMIGTWNKVSSSMALAFMWPLRFQNWTLKSGVTSYEADPQHRRYVREESGKDAKMLVESDHFFESTQYQDLLHEVTTRRPYFWLTTGMSDRYTATQTSRTYLLSKDYYCKVHEISQVRTLPTYRGSERKTSVRANLAAAAIISVTESFPILTFNAEKEPQHSKVPQAST